MYTDCKQAICGATDRSFTVRFNEHKNCIGQTVILPTLQNTLSNRFTCLTPSITQRKFYNSKTKGHISTQWRDFTFMQSTRTITIWMMIIPYSPTRSLMLFLKPTSHKPPPTSYFGAVTPNPSPQHWLYLQCKKHNKKTQHCKEAATLKATYVTHYECKTVSNY